MHISWEKIWFLTFHIGIMHSVSATDILFLYQLLIFSDCGYPDPEHQTLHLKLFVSPCFYLQASSTLY